MREVIQVPMGRVRVYRVTPRCRGVWPGELLPVIRDWQAVTPWLLNAVLYEWGAIVGNLLLRQGSQYGIGGMYIEYENVADPDDEITAPDVTRDASQGIEYYNGLSGSTTKDYLRVPLIAGILNISDAVKFPKGNMPTFFAQTSGETGIHGKAFSAASNSKVYGGALVSFVDANDASQDLVFSRFYLAAENQQSKLDSSQVGLEWAVLLG